MRINKEFLILLSIVVLNLQPADGQETYDVQIWADSSVITLGSYSGLGVKICPTPATDEGRETIYDPETGDVVDPGSLVLMEWYLTAPDGTQTRHQSINPITCDQSWWFGSLPPDRAGTWTAYGVAKWVWKGSIQEVRSNTVEVEVREPIFSGKIEKMVDMDRMLQLFGG